MKILLTLAAATALTMAGCDNNDDATQSTRGVGANTTINDTPNNAANTQAQQAGERSAANGDLTTNTVRTDTTNNPTTTTAGALNTTRPAAQ